MRLKLLRLLIPVLTGSWFLFLSGTLLAQNCIPTNINGSTINLACNQVCTNLNFQIPHLKSSADYTLITVPYAPYPYVTAGGSQDNNLYNDDQYSSLVNLPFTFCFYDALYTSAVVGSNGLMTFDPANASCANAWPITNTIPYAGGTICSAGTTYYPKASIMGAYSDIDPRPEAFPPITATSSPPERKIEWRVEGTAPCRRFVVSYYHIGVYQNDPCSQITPNTFQMVMHESTGIIEVFIEQKACFSSTNNGRAILGIQNWARDKAVAAPGKNNTQWSETNTGYRFVPSGSGSRYVISELYTLTGTLVATADTITTTPGLLDLSFLNVCPPGTTNTYVVKTTFSACENPASQLISYDTVYVNRVNALNATATATNTGCGAPSGTITVTVPAGAGTPPYTFVLDGGAPQTGLSPYTFTNVAGGPHTVVVTDASAGCISTINITVIQNNVLTANAIPTATSCPGANNGQIAVTPNGGTAPYTFILNPGAITQTGNTALFTGLAAGSYTVMVNDAGSCFTSPAISVIVTAGPPLLANATSSATSCSGASNGAITVTPTNGAAPYTFSLDGGAPQAGAAPYTFTNVPAGNHNVVVTDGAGCVTNSIPVTVAAGPVLTTTVNKTDVLCNGGATGTITVTQPTIGTPPYQYSLDGVTWQASNIFNGLAAGTYTVYYRESNGCQGSQSIAIGEPAALTSTTATIAVICNGQNNGIITVTAGGGISPYQYSLDGITWQGSNIFNVAAGNYTVTIKDANNCITTRPATVTEPAVLTASSVNSNASCDGGNDGVITITANGGNTTYQYSIDVVNFQVSNIFNVAPGNYTVTVRDNLGCTTTFNTTVGLTSNLLVTPQTDPVMCEGTSTQLQLNSNATIFTWTPTIALSNSSIANPVANPTVTTQYIVTATLGRCSVNDTVIVNVNAAPIPNAGADGFICYGQSYQLQASGAVSFSWTPSIYLSNTSISNPISTPDRTTTYTLSVIDANGCNSLTTDQVTVDVTPPIKVKTFPYDTIGYPGDQFQLNATSAANIYAWSPATGLSNPDIPNPVLTVGPIGSDILYQVIASTAAGCKGEGYVRVKVYNGPELYVPSGFTPNGDGLNEIFYPFPVGIKSINYFKVFNRWGQLLFSSTTLYKGWDGKLQGVEQPSGVYVFMAQGVDKNGKLLTRKGTVMLIR